MKELVIMLSALLRRWVEGDEEGFKARASCLFCNPAFLLSAADVPSSRPCFPHPNHAQFTQGNTWATHDAHAQCTCA